jgi:hypothetical protein
MNTAPTWQAPVAGQPPKADHVNQFLGPHQVTALYTGNVTSSQTTNGATTTNTNGFYLAQSFTTGASQTAVGLVTLSLTSPTASGAALAPTAVHLYANASGAPSGAPLVSTTVTTDYAFDASGGVNTTRITIPLPVTGLTPSTTYWLVVDAASTGANSYTWFRSNQASGASTSPDGTAWTAQSYGFTYTVSDQTPLSGLLKATWEDGGARWLVWTYDASLQFAKQFEYTAGQTAAGYVQSDRPWNYSGGLISTIT